MMEVSNSQSLELLLPEAFTWTDALKIANSGNVRMGRRLLNKLDVAELVDFQIH
jgi:hypothetical protein